MNTESPSTNIPTPSTGAGTGPRRRPSARPGTLHKLLRDPQAIITTAVLVIVFTLGVLAPVITQHGPNESDLSLVNAPPGTAGYLLGADEAGRDIFSRLLYSTNTAAISALIGGSVALLVGAIAGLVGGYFGRRIRNTTEWVFNLLMSFPGMLLLIVLMPLTGGEYKYTMLIFGVLFSPSIYRIVRNQVLGVKNELFVDAARVSGLGSVRILGRHVLPAVRGPVIIAIAFLAGSAINVQSGLAFLGVGSKQEPSFGAMIATGFTNLYIAPVQFLWPSLMLGIITASLVLLGNSLRDALEGSRPKPQKLEQAPRTTAQGATVAERTEPQALLEITDLAIAYPHRDGLNEVVKGVTLTLECGKILGLVGESGSGKSQTAFATLGVLPPEAVITRGSIRYNGRELVGLTDAQMRPLRGREIAYIPQEPMSNLDPSFKVGAQLTEGIRKSLGLTRAEAKKHVIGLLARCGIADPERTFASYPHQISGGMAQRVLIAGAVASRPKLLIADEPTTALDVTVQAEILDLLRDLQSELDMAVLLVTHNLGVVADICDRVTVMQQGRTVETGETLQVFREPKDPYTKLLLAAILDDDVVRTDVPASAEVSKERA